MSDSLEHYFGELRAVAQIPALADPGDLRQTGDHRTRVRRTVVAACATVLLTAGALAAYGTGVLGPPRTGPDPGLVPGGISPSTGPTPSTGPVLPPTPTPSASASSPAPPSAPTNQATVRPAGADCRPGDLDPRPYYGDEGAMGSHYTTIVVHNVSPTRCRLFGHPTVHFANPSTGASGTMPTTRDGTATPVMLQPGQWAKVVFRTLNGNPYPPGAPECQTPASYRGLSLVIGEDLPFPLPGLTLSWQCAGAHVSAWQPDPDGATGFAATITRAP